MPIPPQFTNATESEALDAAIRTFGESVAATEDDFLAALKAIQRWPKRFTVPFSFEYRGIQITWYRYESLVWALGEQFRQALRRLKRLRRNERVFAAVRAVCLDRRFGKGRETFTMLLGHYGGPAQIPALIGLLKDPEVYGHALYALRLLGAAEAAAKVRPFLKSPKTWVRNEATKYFKKIERMKTRTRNLTKTGKRK
jgi:hypothetical protein